MGFLQRLATETGGIVAPVAIVGGDLTATFRTAFDDFRSRYVLHFTPTGVERGSYHTLEVRVPGNRGSRSRRARILLTGVDLLMRRTAGRR